MFARKLALVFSLSVLCMMFTTTALGQSWNKKTSVTFSGPVEIPGVGVRNSRS